MTASGYFNTSDSVLLGWSRGETTVDSLTVTDLNSGAQDLGYSTPSTTTSQYDASNYGLQLASWIYYALTIPLAIGSNVLMIVTVARQKKLHKPAFYYVCNLAVADIMFASCCSPIYTIQMAYGRVVVPHWLCQIHAFLTQVYAFQVGLKIMYVMQWNIFSILKAHSQANGMFFSFSSVISFWVFEWVKATFQ